MRELTPRPDAMPAWDSLSETQQRLYARQMEVYAGYSENADWNIGRVVDAIEEMGELDNTIIAASLNVPVSVPSMLAPLSPQM